MSEFPRIGSALVAFNDQGLMLLGQRNKGMQKGQWVFPGGGIQEFETIAEAAVRELREETGFNVLYCGHIETREIINAPVEHRIVMFGWGRILDGEMKPADDISGIQFCTPRHAMGEPLTWATREFLKANYRFLEKQSLSFGK
jgi:8-oxo-dGTP diphosphatase